MRRLQILTRTSLFLLMVATHALAGDWIVQLKNPSQANTLSQQFLAQLFDIHSSDGIYRIKLPSGSLGTMLAQMIQASPLVQSIEPDALLTVPKAGSGYTMPNGSQLAPPVSQAWAAYLGQSANTEIHIAAAQAKTKGAGVTVAVIDTGVDPTTPALAARVGPIILGPDFTGNNDPAGTVAQETSPMVDQETSPMVDQETSPMVDSAGTVILDHETSPMVDQETSPLVDQETSPMVDGLGEAFGHGTMVAGIINLVAPNSTILSIKAFANDGSASISSIVAALYYAADHGANVINASWSTGTASPQLQKAVDYVTAHKSIIVAAVANNGANTVVYPAGYNNVIGVACTQVTNGADARCSFSNYGTDVTVGAPGSGITTTFPVYAAGAKKNPVSHGFAMGWGTSFATPYVAGTVALIESLKWNTNANQAANDVQGGAAPMHGVPGMGAGRLDVNGAVSQVK